MARIKECSLVDNCCFFSTLALKKSGSMKHWCLGWEALLRSTVDWICVCWKVITDFNIYSARHDFSKFGNQASQLCIDLVVIQLLVNIHFFS